MHKLYSTKAGGGRRELKLGALHKRGAAIFGAYSRSACGIAAQDMVIGVSSF